MSGFGIWRKLFPNNAQKEKMLVWNAKTECHHNKETNGSIHYHPLYSQTENELYHTTDTLIRVMPTTFTDKVVIVTKHVLCNDDHAPSVDI